ncbi:uncharacterized protein LOC129286830 [Prosopis cineraria]|uniref:uncharacterized protein LOC129286830 n=1 Tax=Prosopis cineraria TaxID=364024 RepID=UPI00241088C8|nr:uncharacterized protein LOC129286830 [Prosopis cineraria]
MEVIVATDQVSESLDAAFMCPRLTCLDLSYLPNLRNFYAQGQKLEWPYLHQLDIDGCGEIEILEKKVSSSSEIHGEESAIDSKYPLLSCNKDDRVSYNLFSNFKKLVVYGCGFVILVPFQVLRSLHSLEELTVNKCEELEVVFDLEDLNDCKERQSSSVVLPLKKLWLWSLPKLKNVWSNHHGENVCFQSLSQIHVSLCDSLTSVFPASIAKGMLHCLEQLEVRKCADMEVIVATDQVSESLDAAFVCPRLTSLKLFGLPNLRNFYAQTQKLEPRHLVSCGETEIFEKEVSCSAEIHGEESTIDSKYPLLSCNKDDRFSNNLFSNLKKLVVDGCGFVILVPFQVLRSLHSLEKLQVKTVRSWKWCLI